MFYDEFLRLCEKNGVSKTKACVDCGVSRTAWRKWADGAVPNGATLDKLAAYFSVSVDFLLGQEKEKPSTVSGEGLSDSDIKLLEWFRSLPEEKRRAILIASDAPEDVL